MYLDNNATTELYPEVKKAIMKAFDLYGNPSSSNSTGVEAKRVLERARAEIARLLHIDSPRNLVFTGSATEANNIVLQGVVKAYRTRTNAEPHVVTTSVEHASVYSTVVHLEQQGLCEATLLPVQRCGRIDLKQLEQSIKPNTALVSVILGNNEVGVLQDWVGIKRTCVKHKVPLHFDMTQVVGRYPVCFSSPGRNSSPFLVNCSDVDFATWNSHKHHGPKGVGFLFSRRLQVVQPVLYGGHQEQGVRPSTECVPLIVGGAVALKTSLDGVNATVHRVAKLRDLLKRELQNVYPGVKFNCYSSDVMKSLYNTLSVCFCGKDSRELLKKLSHLGLCVNVGSACNLGHRSRILEAVGASTADERGVVRFSLSTLTTLEDIQTCVKVMNAVLK